jgi:Phage integrase, N-terminal SAM-like domain
MAVDDLWYLRKRDPITRERLPSKRYGRGKRWRVRWNDPDTGRSRAELFDRKIDADRYDANRQADISRGQYIDPDAGRITVAEYAKLWQKNQLHRASTAQRCERVIRCHIVPVLGSLPLSRVRPSHLKGWVKDRAQVLAPTTLRVIYFGTIVPMFHAAVADRRIGNSPCVLMNS